MAEANIIISKRSESSITFDRHRELGCTCTIRRIPEPRKYDLRAKYYLYLRTHRCRLFGDVDTARRVPVQSKVCDHLSQYRVAVPALLADVVTAISNVAPGTTANRLEYESSTMRTLRPAKDIERH